MKALWLPKISYIKKTNIFHFQEYIKKDLKITTLTVNNKIEL